MEMTHLPNSSPASWLFMEVLTTRADPVVQHISSHMNSTWPEYRRRVSQKVPGAEPLRNLWICERILKGLLNVLTAYVENKPASD